MKQPKIFIPFCLLCGLLLGWQNFAGLNLRDAGSELAAPRWTNGFLQRPDQADDQARDLLCLDRVCADGSPWPEGEDPASWLKSLGYEHAQKGKRSLPQAPALVRHPEGWLLLITEASDRLEVLTERGGSGVWPPGRWTELEGLAWWGLRR